MKLYILTFDALNSNISPSAVYQYVKDSRHILAFAHHYPGAYLIVSELNARELTHLLRGIFTNLQGNCANFLVAEVAVENMDGIMPLAAWEWIWDYRKIKDPLFGALLERRTSRDSDHE